MTQRFPRVTAAEAITALEKAGFKLARQSGSHKIFVNEAGKRVTVPYHAGRTLHPKLLKAILRDAGMAPEDIVRILMVQGAPARAD